jgi:hypothetical protein
MPLKNRRIKEKWSGVVFCAAKIRIVTGLKIL